MTLKGGGLNQFDERRREFTSVFEEVQKEMKAKARHDITLEKIMQEVWESKGVWFWYCLSSANAMHLLLEYY